MRILAYCAADYSLATREAAGITPVTCPPLTADTLDPSMLERDGEGHPYDLLYFNLHSPPDAGAFLATRGGPPVALKAVQLRGLDLSGAACFAVNCYIGDDDHPMRRALLDAGASYVIAGGGKNYGVNNTMYQRIGLKGADILGLWLRRGMELGMSAPHALRFAKLRVRVAALRSAAARDALGFESFGRT